EPDAMNQGTQIAVKDLFFNTPARRKFLKGRTTEYRHIMETMKRFALGYPEIRFELFHGDHESLNLPPASLQERIGAIFGSGYTKNIIGIDEMYREMEVSGFIGNLDLVRKSRGEQYLYLNNRYISDNLLNTAVYKGYQSLIHRGEYPFFVLKIGLDPEEFDVNVHPSKMEVKFRNQWYLYNYVRDLVTRSMQDVLQTAGHFRKSAPGEPEEPGAGIRQQNWTDTIRPPEDPRFTPPTTGSGGQQLPQYPTDLRETSGSDSEAAPHIARVNRYARKGPQAEQDIAEQVWQVHNTYILSQIKSGIVILDQHVAHERVLFEEALQSFKEQTINSQQMLFPQVIEFSPDDFDLLLELLPYLEKIGFELKEFGKNTVILNATPSDMRGSDEAKMIREIIDEYKERRDKDNPIHYNLAASYACKAAIKAGDPLSNEEMRGLIHRLFQCGNPYHCPHGRPIVVNLSLDEIHKRFERK
ncbi:MAG TPA: DNA mismatch repair endonuclease MutL, partial [bacterium]|nr:DNA mismatch repair endonuclease MutL [bacterium]